MPPRPGRRLRAAPSAERLVEPCQRPGGATARSDASPSLRSRSGSFFCATGVAARPRSRSSLRARGSRPAAPRARPARLSAPLLPPSEPADAPPPPTTAHARSRPGAPRRALRREAAASASSCSAVAAASAACASRAAVSASATSSATRSRSGAIRSRAAATIGAGSPSRAAVCNACDVPGRPRTDLVERLVAVGVDAGRGVGRAVGCARPLLELREVARRHRQPRLTGERVEQDSRALLLRPGRCRRRARRGERATRSLPARGSRSGCVRARERRQAHRDRLLVPDVEEDRVEDR